MGETNLAGDLHMHTTASDGTVSADRRIELANEAGIETIALTDHDILSEWVTEPSTHKDGVDVITGVEVRANLFDTKIEILGYYLDPTDPELLNMLERARRFRRDRNEQIVKNLNKVTDLSLSYKELSASVDGNLGRPHIADYLIEAGVVDSVGEAFGEYLAEGGAAYVPMERIPAAEVVSTIHGAGGVTSLAHPGRIRTDTETVKRMVEELAAVGLDGIETWYPYGQIRDSEYADIGVDDAHDLAEQYDLIPTGGSDCHGPDSGKFRLGEVGVSEEILSRLRKRADDYSGSN